MTAIKHSKVCACGWKLTRIGEETLEPYKYMRYLLETIPHITSQ